MDLRNTLQPFDLQRWVQGDKPLNLGIQRLGSRLLGDEFVVSLCEFAYRGLPNFDTGPVRVEHFMSTPEQFGQPPQQFEAIDAPFAGTNAFPGPGDRRSGPTHGSLSIGEAMSADCGIVAFTPVPIPNLIATIVARCPFPCLG